VRDEPAHIILVTVGDQAEVTGVTGAPAGAKESLYLSRTDTARLQEVAEKVICGVQQPQGLKPVPI